jgi:hypothetical protein
MRDIFTLCGTLLPGRFAGHEIRDLLAEVLPMVDPTALGQQITEELGVLLTGLGRHDPGMLDWLDEEFIRTDLTPGHKLAIAVSVLNLDGAERHGRAWRLRTLPACPPEVATLILNEVRASA